MPRYTGAGADAPAFARIGGIAAIGFAVLIVSNVAILVPAGMPVTGAEPAEVRAFFTTNGGIVDLASLFVPVMWVLLTLFGAGAVATLWPSERDRGEAWSLVGLAGLVLQNATFAAIAAVRLALASTAADDSAATGGLWAGGLWAVHDALFTLNGTFLALALIGLSTGGRRAGLIRPWHGNLGLLSAALLFSSATLTPWVIGHAGPLGLIGLTGWLMWVVWIVTYGLALIRLPHTAPPHRARHLVELDERPTMQPVTWINIFDVPADRADEFSTIWQADFAPHFSAKPGFVSYKMHRAVSSDARFRFVNIALWESAEHITTAHDERFRELVSRPELDGITAHPGIYTVISEG